MSETKPHQVLMVDDEPLVLAGYRRTVGRSFSVTCCEGGAAGLETLQASGPFSVIITDMRMPKMNGIEFITAARQKSRDSVFMMLTGNADQQTAVDAVNQGNIFRFLNKPCPPELLDSSIKAAIRQYELVTAERVLLRDTFAGSIKFMTEALELSNPELFAFQSTVKQIQHQVCTAIGIRCDWQLSVAASLCLIGLMTMPGLSAKDTLTDETLCAAASLGARLLNHLPRIGPMVAMIRRQREVAAPLPTDLQTLSPEDFERVGAQVLRFSVDLAREQRRTTSRTLAAGKLAQYGQYDPRLLSVFSAASEPVEATASAVETILVSDVKPGMILAADIRRSNGTLLLSKDQIISELALASLLNFADCGIVSKKISVRAAIPEIAAAA